MSYWAYSPYLPSMKDREYPEAQAPPPSILLSEARASSHKQHKTSVGERECERSTRARLHLLVFKAKEVIVSQSYTRDSYVHTCSNVPFIAF